MNYPFNTFTLHGIRMTPKEYEALTEHLVKNKLIEITRYELQDFLYLLTKQDEVRVE